MTATTEAPALHMMDHVTVTQDGLGVDAKMVQYGTVLCCYFIINDN